MSVCATVKPTKRIGDLKNILISLAKQYGYGIVCKQLSDEFCQFYIDNVSTRPIDISKEEDGWEVRITSCATEEDYILFSRSIEAVKQATNGTVMSDEDEPVENPLDFYGKEWRDNQMEADIDIIIAMSHHKREDGKYSEIQLFGVVCNFCIGLNLLNELGISRDTDRRVTSEALINRFRYSQYGRPRDIDRTSINMQITTPEGEKKSVTVYAKNAYGMISFADFIFIMYDVKNAKNSVLLKYDDFMKIAPEAWELFDEKQYFTTDLSDEEFDSFFNRAKQYNVM